MDKNVQDHAFGNLHSCDLVGSLRTVLIQAGSRKSITVIAIVRKSQVMISFLSGSLRQLTKRLIYTFTTIY